MYELTTLDQKGAQPLLHLIESKDDWEKKRSEIKNTWLSCMGGLPPLVPTHFDITAWESHEDYHFIKVKYNSVFDDKVPANLLIPRGSNCTKITSQENAITVLNASHKQYPCILALHPTSDNGKDDVSTTEGRENRQYGLELVKRGYVVLAPDAITAGERVRKDDKPFQTASFDAAYPNWSAVAKMLVDHQQGLSLLESLNCVDSDKIGVIGHSLGGYNGYFLAGVDRRIKAVVCSCGFATFAGDPEIHRWGKREWFSHMPQLSDYIKDGKVPFEFTEIAALVAPTPFFLWMGQNDSIFPHWKPAAEGFYELNSLYKWMESVQQIQTLIGNSGHDFPYEIRHAAYLFLDKWLMR